MERQTQETKEDRDGRRNKSQIGKVSKLSAENFREKLSHLINQSGEPICYFVQLQLSGALQHLLPWA